MLYTSKIRFSRFEIFILVLVENIAKLFLPRSLLNISLFILLCFDRPSSLKILAIYRFALTVLTVSGLLNDVKHVALC